MSLSLSALRKLIAWLSRWATTLHIIIFKRDLYRILRAEFAKADEPEMGSE